MTFTAFIPGHTPGKARPRVTRKGTFMPHPYERWMKRACLRAKAAHALDGATTITTPVAISIVVTVWAPERRPAKTAPARPLWHKPTATKKVFPWIGTRGDADNVAGSVLDALVKARVIDDDRLVGKLEITLLATHDPELVGASVTVCPLIGGEE